MASIACLEPYIKKNEDPNEVLRLDELIAEGSFGCVYKGVYKATGDVLAIKIIKLEEDETFDDLVIEIEIMSKCHHPNIVGYYGSWRKNDELFIAMELCDGGSAADIYQDIGSPLSEPAIALICREAIKGLRYMHAAGYLHRDIKGANILVKQDGTVKVIDFGVSGRITPDCPTRRTFIGTPYWMAPEVIENKGSPSPYDFKADVWSLGITLIELAQADPPLSELHPMKALFQIPYRNPPTLARPGDWSAEFVDFLGHCLQKNPAQRWSYDQLLEHPWLAKMCPPSNQVLQKLVADYLVAKRLLDEEDEEGEMEGEGEDEREAVEELARLEAQPKASIPIPPPSTPPPPPSSSSSSTTATESSSTPITPPPPAAAAATAPITTEGGEASGGMPIHPQPIKSDGSESTSQPSTTEKSATEAKSAAEQAQVSVGTPAPAASPAARPVATTTSQQQAQSRPKTVHRGTARRTEEIRKNINRKLMRKQIGEIKALTKAFEKELDQLQGKQSDQLQRVSKAQHDKLAKETSRREKENEQHARKFAADKESEQKRHKSEMEGLAKQQASTTKAWCKEQGRAADAQRKTSAAHVAQKLKELKEQDKAAEKEHKAEARKVREMRRALRKCEGRQATERMSMECEHKIAAERAVNEREHSMKLLAEAQERECEFLARCYAAEAAWLGEQHKRQVELVDTEKMNALEGLRKVQDEESAQLVARQQMQERQQGQRIALENDQHKKRQAMEVRERTKEFKQKQKKEHDDFIDSLKAELKSAKGDKKALRAAQKQRELDLKARQKDAEAEWTAKLHKELEDDDAILAKNHEEQQRGQRDSQAAERAAQGEQHAAKLAEVAADYQRRREELLVCAAREDLDAMRAYHRERAAREAEHAKRRSRLLGEKLAAERALLTANQGAETEWLKSMHKLQEDALDAVHAARRAALAKDKKVPQEGRDAAEREFAEEKARFAETSARELESLAAAHSEREAELERLAKECTEDLAEEARRRCQEVADAQRAEADALRARVDDALRDNTMCLDKVEFPEIPEMQKVMETMPAVGSEVSAQSEGVPQSLVSGPITTSSMVAMSYSASPDPSLSQHSAGDIDLTETETVTEVDDEEEDEEVDEEGNEDENENDSKSSENV